MDIYELNSSRYGEIQAMERDTSDWRGPFKVGDKILIDR